MEKTYEGLLELKSRGEGDNILHLEDEVLTDLIQGDIEKYGHYLSVSYWISATRKSKDELTENLLKSLYGEGQADYGDRWSDITGYLWTDEDLIVGGHDLLEELKASCGKYLYMEIIFNTSSIQIPAANLSASTFNQRTLGSDR
jgi:hypothetical protein